MLFPKETVFQSCVTTFHTHSYLNNSAPQGYMLPSCSTYCTSMTVLLNESNSMKVIRFANDDLKCALFCFIWGKIGCNTSSKINIRTNCTWYVIFYIFICYTESYLQQLFVCKWHDSFKYNDTGTIHSFLKEATNNYSTLLCVSLLANSIKWYIFQTNNN